MLVSSLCAYRFFIDGGERESNLRTYNFHTYMIQNCMYVHCYRLNPSHHGLIALIVFPLVSALWSEASFVFPVINQGCL